jgi:hypothetical protein
MKFDLLKDNETLTLRLYGDRSKALVYHQAVVVIALCLLYSLVYIDPGYLQAPERILGKVIGFSWLTFTVLRQQFAVCDLVVSDTTVTLERRLFRIGRKRVFPRTDTERLGYEAANQYDDAALAIMVRTVMMPMRFAHGITPEEARHVFEQIHDSGSWIGSMIRPVGVPMF